MSDNSSKDTSKKGGSSSSSRSRKSFVNTANKVYGKVGYGIGSFPAIVLMVFLFRWFMTTDFGVIDPFFVQYPDGSGLYFADVFQFLRDLFSGLSDLRTTIQNIASVDFGGYVSSDPVSAVVNVLPFVLNLILALLKILIFVPFEIVGLIFGGFFHDWISPGGWISYLMDFHFPYMNVVDFFNMLGETLSGWWSDAWNGIVSWWDGVWSGIQGWFTSWWDGIWNGIRSWFESLVPW